MSKPDTIHYYQSPTVEDVHVPVTMPGFSVRVSQLKKDKKKEPSKSHAEATSYFLSNVEIFKAGTYKDEEISYNESELDKIVKNTNEYIEKNIHNPPLKLGHNEGQEFSGKPAVGWIIHVEKHGDSIFADIDNVPKEVMDAINEKRYRKLSAEIYTEDYKPLGLSLRAVALLGADVPEVKGLRDLPTLYSDTDKGYLAVVFMSEQINNNGGKTMKTVFTFEDMEALCPSCAKWMETNKMEKVTLSELRQHFKTYFNDNPDEDSEVDIILAMANMFDKLPDDEKKKYKNMEDDKRPPKGWFDKCVSSVGDKADDPAALCGWIYAHQMGPEAKAKVESTRQTEKPEEVKKMEDEKTPHILEMEKQIKEGQDKIVKLQEELKRNRIDKFIETAKSQGKIRPADEPFLRAILSKMEDNTEIVKFGEKGEDKTVSDLMKSYIGNLPQIIHFEELLKGKNLEDVELDETASKDKEVKNEELAKKVKKYGEEHPTKSYRECVQIVSSQEK